MGSMKDASFILLSKVVRSVIAALIPYPQKDQDVNDCCGDVKLSSPSFLFIEEDY